MFTAEFKENNSCEIPLPGKKASEIKELLLMIYLNIYGKAWNTVKLADEYQMEEIFKRCENVLVNLVHSKPDNTFLDDLTFAQTYKLEKQLTTIVNRARQLRLRDFKSHEMYDKMDPHIYKQIMEGIVEDLEKNLSSYNSYYR